MQKRLGATTAVVSIGSWEGKCFLRSCRSRLYYHFVQPKLHGGVGAHQSSSPSSSSDTTMHDGLLLTKTFSRDPCVHWRHWKSSVSLPPRVSYRNVWMGGSSPATTRRRVGNWIPIVIGQKRLLTNSAVRHEGKDHVKKMWCCSSNENNKNATSQLTWTKRLPAFLQCLNEAEFVSLDIELTGLHTRLERFVGVDRCYEAHSEGARSFIPMQLGLCAAKRQSPTGRGFNHWILTPISVFVYPRADRIFQVATSALTFLKDNNFDFNQWLSNGVGFLRIPEERERREAIEGRIAEVESLKAKACASSASSSSTEHIRPGLLQTGEASEIEIPDATDREVVDRVRLQIKEWLTPQHIHAGDGHGGSESLEIPMESAFQRLLLHTVIAHEFPTVYSYSSRKGDVRMLCVYRSQTELYDEQLRSLRQELSQIDEMVGVRRLFDVISTKHKVLVGHNCFYDLLHLYQSFYDELPASVSEFKKSWTDRFSHTFDTKYLAEAHELLSSLQPPATLKGLCDFMVALSAAQTDSRRLDIPPRLAALRFSVNCVEGSNWRLPRSYRTCAPDILVHSGNNDVTVDLTTAAATTTPPTPSTPHAADRPVMASANCASTAISASAEQDEDSSHDAGFDSLMTSMLFILQCDHILKAKQMSWQDVHFDSTSCNTRRWNTPRKSGGEALQPDRQCITNLLPLMDNRIRLVRTQPNVLNLAGKDEADMSRHLLMTDFPPDWKKWDIMKAFSPVWVTTCWIDSQSCWVIARSDEDVKNILMIYKLSNPPLYRLHTYEEYKQLQQGPEKQRPPGSAASSPQVSQQTSHC